MGHTCCKTDTTNASTELAQSRTLEDDFFDKYHTIKHTLRHEKAEMPQTWVINRHLVTTIHGQGHFLGKRSAITRSGYGVMLYEYKSEGLYYIGYWHGNCKQGLGIMVDNYGSFYKGEWAKDEPNGYGEYYDTTNKRYYKGKWKNGKKEGLGEQSFPDGTKFVGSYKEDLKHGLGKYIFIENGCYFEGTFENDTIVGSGKQRGTNFEYTGPWLNGLMHGAGRCIYYDDRGKVFDEYVGQFEKGVKHGYGEYRWANGAVYKGQWVNGAIINRGVFIMAH